MIALTQKASQSWRCGEVENVLLQSVQTAYKPLRDTKSNVPCQRNAAPPMEVPGYWRLNPVWYDDCTHAKSILTQSWRCGEVENVLLQSVQTAYKPLRSTKSKFPNHRNAAPPMEVPGYWRLNPVWYDDCTHAKSILTQSWRCGEVENVLLQSVQTAYKPLRDTTSNVPCQRNAAPPMEVPGYWPLNPVWYDDCTYAKSILTQSWRCGEVENVLLQSVQTAYKPLRSTKSKFPNHRNAAPPMEVPGYWRLNPVWYDDCTHAKSILTQSWRCGEVENVLLQSVQTAYKPLRDTKSNVPCHRNAAPPMEVPGYWRLNPVWYDDCTHAKSILTQSWRCGEVENVLLQSVQTAYKPLRDTKSNVPCQRNAATPMEVPGYWRLNPVWYDDCTYAKSILTQSWRWGEVENVLLQSVQTAYQPLRSTKSKVPNHRNAAPPMEVPGYWRLNPVWYDDCTYAKSILTQSWRCGEVENVLLQSVQTAYKPLRNTKSKIPNHRNAAPPMEVPGYWRLNPVWYDDCTYAKSILTQSWRCGEVENVLLQSVQTAYKPLRNTKSKVPCHHNAAPPMEVPGYWRLNPVWYDDCTYAKSILTQSWRCGEVENVLLQSVQTAYKPLRNTKSKIPNHRNAAPPMEVPGYWRLNPVWYDDCTYAKSILTQSWRCGEVENVLLPSVQTAYQPLRSNKSKVPNHRNAAPPMEVPRYWRLNPVWYDDCTYAKSILTQSWRCGEVENVLLQSVQTAYKPLRDTKSNVPCHRNAAPPMEVPGYWRLNPVWYDDCTYAKSILTQSWRCGEVENVLLQSVQTAYKPLRNTKSKVPCHHNAAPPMEVPGYWRLNPVWYDDCTYAKSILTQSWRCGEVENVLLQSVQTAYKPLRNTKSKVPCHHNAAPPMEVPGYWRLNPVWYDDCTYAKSILTQSWRCGEVENVLLQSVQTAYKPLRNTKSKIPNHRNAAPPMEVPGYWRLNPVWYDDCTYAKSILTQSWRCGEVENVLLPSVQTAYQPLRSNKSKVPNHRNAAPPMEVPRYWRLNPVWYDDCTYAKSILTQSWRCGEVENVLLQSVQTAYKPLRDTKSNVPCHRNAAPPMEVPGYWRLNPVWYDDCTYAKSILTQSWRCGEVENVLLQSVQTAYKPLRNTKSKVPCHHNAAPPMEVPGYWRLNPVWYDDCTYAKSILTQSWRCGEVENVLLQSVQTAYKPLRNTKSKIPNHRNAAPPMEVPGYWRLNPVWYDDCTHAKGILTQSWRCGEVENVLLQSVQTAYKPLRNTKSKVPCHRNAAPPMEIPGYWRLNPVWYDDCTYAKSILTQSWRCGEVENVLLQSVQTAYKPLRDTKSNVPCHRNAAPPMEVPGYWRLNPVWYDDCTHAKSILTQSWRCGEVENVLLQSVQTAYKPLRDTKSNVPCHRNAAPPMEVPGYWRLNPVWYDDCTYAKSILTQSWRCGEVENVLLQSVQTAYKPLRDSKSNVPCQRNAAPPMEVPGYWRLNPVWYDDCTYAKSILTQSWRCGEVENVLLQSVQTAYQPLRSTKSKVPNHRNAAPPMEVPGYWRLNPVWYDDCTHAKSILTQSWRCGEVENVLLQSVQTAYKPLRNTKSKVPCHRNAAPPMEIPGYWRLNRVWYDDCTYAKSILTQSWRCGEVENVLLQSVQTAYKPLRDTKSNVPCHRNAAPPMEVPGYWRLNPVWYDDCTYAKSILTQSWRCGEVENVLLQSVQTAYKPLRNTKSKVPCHRNAALPMEIPGYWRLNPVWYDDCTYAKSILTQSWRCGEVENVLLQSVQTAYKPLRDTKSNVPCHRNAAPPMDVPGYWRLNPVWYDDCTYAKSILTQSWRCGEVENVLLQSVQTAYKPLRNTKSKVPCHRNAAPPMEVPGYWRLNPVWYDDCTHAKSILTQSWRCGEVENVLLQSVQTAYKPLRNTKSKVPCHRNAAPPMEIPGYWRLNPVWYDDCTYAKIILTQSWRCGEVENVLLQSVQTAYKPLRNTKSKVPCHRNAAPPMEIPGYWRLNPVWYDDCTYAKIILTQSWRCGEVENVLLQSVQTAYKPLRDTKSNVPCHRNAAPPMEVPGYWRLNPVWYDDCTYAKSILTQSWRCGEVENVLLQSVQTAYKPLRNTNSKVPCHHNAAPPMEVPGYWRLNPVWYDDCTYAKSILTQSWRCGEVENVLLQSVQTAYKPLRDTKSNVPCHRNAAPPMEVPGYWRLNPVWYDDCTYAKSILTQSWRCGEVENVLLQSVQTAYKPLRNTKSKIPNHRNAVPPMEVPGYWRLNPVWYDDCTYAKSILTQSWRCGEVENVLLQSVQTAYKSLRNTKSKVPCHHNAAPPMEVPGYWRLNPVWYDDCTYAKSILQ